MKLGIFQTPSKIGQINYAINAFLRKHHKQKENWYSGSNGLVTYSWRLSSSSLHKLFLINALAIVVASL